MPSHGVVAKTAWRGIRCSSVLKSSACKFSEEKTNQIWEITTDKVSKFQFKLYVTSYLKKQEQLCLQSFPAVE